MDQEKINQKYTNEFVDRVHLIGRITMVLGFLLSFAPVFYLVVIKGYVPPANSFSSVVISIVGYAIAMWLTEPLSYLPILGAGGTYMAYLSGNVSNMRAPVAMSVQSSLDADINTPRGQMATIISIAISVYANLVILLVIVMIGEWLLSILPAKVVESLRFVLPSLFGAMIVMRLRAGGKKMAFYLPFAIAAFFVVKISAFKKVPVLQKMSTFGVAIAVLTCVIVAFVQYNSMKKDQTS